MSAAKAQRLIREAEERGVRKAEDEMSNMRNYADMLKHLLHKETMAREEAEQKAAKAMDEADHRLNEQVATLKERHANDLSSQERSVREELTAYYNREVDRRVSQLVAEARASDQLRYERYKDVEQMRSTLTKELEQKFAKRSEEYERTIRTLTAELDSLQTKFDSLQSEHKAAQQRLEDAEATIAALEHRCANLEKLRSPLKAARTIIKYLSCRVFMNVVRLKKALHQVYDSLSVLHEKMSESAEYDRSSSSILPQHELEVWLARTASLVSKHKTHHFAAVFAVKGVSALRGEAAARVAQAALAASRDGSSNTSTALVPVAPAQPSSRRSLPTRSLSRRRKGAAGTARLSRLFPAGLPVALENELEHQMDSALIGLGAASNHHANGTDVDDDDDADEDESSSLTNRRNYRLHTTEMLTQLTEVEGVLRGALQQSLQSRRESHAAQTDIFERNQTLIRENMTLRDQVKNLNEQIVTLQTMQRTMESPTPTPTSRRGIHPRSGFITPSSSPHSPRLAPSSASRRAQQRSNAQSPAHAPQLGWDYVTALKEWDELTRNPMAGIKPGKRSNHDGSLTARTWTQHRAATTRPSPSSRSPSASRPHTQSPLSPSSHPPPHSSPTSAQQSHAALVALCNEQKHHLDDPDQAQVPPQCQHLIITNMLRPDPIPHTPIPIPIQASTLHHHNKVATPTVTWG